MDYSLLKTIETPLPYLQPHFPLINLTSTPSKDLVNPGIGQIVRLYSFYVPLTPVTHPYEITKIDNKTPKISNQAGFGEESLEKENNTLDNENSVNNNDENSESISENSKTLDEGVLDSFQHPKIKVGKVVINKTISTKVTKNGLKGVKTSKHKFKIV